MFIPTKENIRNVVPYEFHKGINASAAAKSIQCIYVVDILIEISCRNLFSGYRTGLEILGSRTSQRVVQNYQIQRIWKIPLWLGNSVKFNVSHTSILHKLKKIRRVSVIGKSVSHSLSPENHKKHVDCCKSLLTEQIQMSFFEQVCHW